MIYAIRQRLEELRDEKYAAFQRRIIPGIPSQRVLGVRMPQLRQLASELQGTNQERDFMLELTHETLEEDLLHSIFISQLKDAGRCVEELERFLPHVDNWSVCDSLRPKVLYKEPELLLRGIERWIASPHLYTCRFAMEMLMMRFLEEDFQPRYADMVAQVETEEYYLCMMQAWYFATALAKQYAAILPYIERGRLSLWTHNKAIQKACESYRISPKQKEYLKTLKR